MNKMKEEHTKSKEIESQLVEEIERLKRKVTNTQNSTTNLRQNKGKFLYELNCSLNGTLLPNQSLPHSPTPS